MGANYLWDRKQKEALALLKRFDYEAVDTILKPYYSQNPNVEKLLEAAKYWNNCKFQEFANILENRAIERSQQWWWTGYEAAYLATVRMAQGNIVEAFFHSFRAFEGILAYWAKHYFEDIVVEDNGGMYFSRSIFQEIGRAKLFSQAKYKNGIPDDDLAKLEVRVKKFFEDSKDNNKNFLLEFSSLCKIFCKIRSEYKDKCPSIKDLLTDKISEKRNKVVHQLKGMTEQDLLYFWGFDSIAV